MDFWILNGVIDKTTRLLGRKRDGRTNFLHIMKQIFEELAVPYLDTCCPDTGFSPVRRNNDTNVLEYFDYTTKEWTEYVPTT